LNLFRYSSLSRELDPTYCTTRIPGTAEATINCSISLSSFIEAMVTGHMIVRRAERVVVDFRNQVLPGSAVADGLAGSDRDSLDPKMILRMDH